MSAGESSNEAMGTASSAGPSDLQPGSMFDGRYQIVSFLGRGGMCTVYKAEHKDLQRLVALKVLHRSLLIDPDAVKRFQREALAVKSLEHPNIVRVYGFGCVDEATPYIALEFLEGRSLAGELKAQGSLGAQEALPIFCAILDALEAAHSQGVVHRDLKPSNVMIAGDGTVKLVDFGIAKVFPESGRELQKLTQTGALFGTVQYMSPEQCLGNPVDARSDLYSMGCLMYETLDGAAAFEADNPFVTVAKHVAGELRLSRVLETDLGAVISRAMAVNPDDRPQSAAELKSWLLNPAPVKRRPAKPAVRPGIRLGLGQLLIGAMSIMVLISVMYLKWQESTTEGQNQTSAVLLEAGNKAMQSYRWEDAIKAFTKYLTYEPRSAEAYYQRGVAEFESNEWQKALQDYTQSLKIDPNQAAVFHCRGVCNFHLQHLDSAAQDCIRSTELFSKELAAAQTADLKDDSARKRLVNLYVGRARVYLQMDQLEKTASDCRSALKLDPYCEDAQKTLFAAQEESARDQKRASATKSN